MTLEMLAQLELRVQTRDNGLTPVYIADIERWLFTENDASNLQTPLSAHGDKLHNHWKKYIVKRERRKLKLLPLCTNVC